MNFSAKSNMYSVARDTVLDRYARHVELAGGGTDAFTPLFCVVSQAPLGENAKKALAIANRAYVLETGNIVLSGDAKEMMNNDSIKKAYLGE